MPLAALQGQGAGGAGGGMSVVRHDWRGRDETLLALRAEGLSFRKIGDRMGVNEAGVRRRHRFLTGRRSPDSAADWTPPSSLLRIRALCAEAFRVSEEDMIGMRRWRHLVHARQAACWVVRRARPKLSYPRIGVLLGGRDHSTVIHAVRQAEYRIARDPALAARLDALVALCARPDQRQHDAHVAIWRARAAEAIRAAALAEVRRIEEDRATAERLREEDEYLAALDPARSFCGQCDRAVTEAEAARCYQRLCPNRTAANGACPEREAA